MRLIINDHHAATDECRGDERRGADEHSGAEHAYRGCGIRWSFGNVVGIVQRRVQRHIYAHMDTVGIDLEREYRPLVSRADPWYLRERGRERPHLRGSRGGYLYGDGVEHQQHVRHLQDAEQWWRLLDRYQDILTGAPRGTTQVRVRRRRADR